jgi:hypothetical protein
MVAGGGGGRVSVGQGIEGHGPASQHQGPKLEPFQYITPIHDIDAYSKPGGTKAIKSPWIFSRTMSFQNK